MIAVAKKLYPDSLKWRRSIYRLAGTPRFVEAIDKGDAPENIVELWKGDVAAFQKIRHKYLLYE